MWENLVGRSRPFWHFFYPRAQAAFPDQLANVDVDDFIAGINRVKPSLIRIKADEVTYGMHIILRFELEQDIVNGRVELRITPGVSLSNRPSDRDIDWTWIVLHVLSIRPADSR